MGIEVLGGKEGYETCDYVVDVEYRKTLEEINKIKEDWVKSGKYFDIIIDKTVRGYAINGYKRVRPYII